MDHSLLISTNLKVITPFDIFSLTDSLGKAIQVALSLTQILVISSDILRQLKTPLRKVT